MANRYNMPVILLTKAINIKEVIFKAELFLNAHLFTTGTPEPDYFMIGGRFTGKLSPKGDIIPLVDCINIVKSEEVDTKVIAEGYWQAALAAKATENENKDYRKQYCGSVTEANLYCRLMRDEFTPTEHRVYDIDTHSSKAPKMIKNYWAVIYHLMI